MIQQTDLERNTQQDAAFRCVYLLHFSAPLKHARHYLGYTRDLDRRIAMHRRGVGARLPQVVQAAGISMHLARIWPDGDRTLERRLKDRHNSAKLCPICRAEAQKAGCHA